jgi:hypothetical protein
MQNATYSASLKFQKDVESSSRTREKQFRKSTSERDVVTFLIIAIAIVIVVFLFS